MDQRQRAFAAEVDVGLVDDDDAAGIAPDEAFDVGERQGQPRGSVGIGDEDGFVQADVVAHVHRKVFAQRNLFARHAVQRREDLVKTVGDVGEGGGVPGVAEGREGEVEDLVGTVGAQDLFGREMVDFGQFRVQGAALGVGVEVQPARGLRGGAEGSRGRRKRRFVRIQLDELLAARLFARHVGDQPGVFAAEKAAHCFSSIRLRTLRACPVSPSRRAKPATSGAALRKAARV